MSAVSGYGGIARSLGECKSKNRKKKKTTVWCVSTAAAVNAFAFHSMFWFFCLIKIERPHFERTCHRAIVRVAHYQLRFCRNVHADVQSIFSLFFLLRLIQSKWHGRIQSICMRNDFHFDAVRAWKIWRRPDVTASPIAKVQSTTE